MARRVLVQRGTEGFYVVEGPAPDERTLQDVVKANPQLLPADDLGFDDDLVVVGRETGLASGAIDLACLARTGDLVLAEFKTGPQNPDFRHALAQVIDYGSDLWRMSVDDFDRTVVQRYLASSHVDPAAHGADDLDGLLDRAGWNLDAEQRAALRDRLGEVLATGDFTFVVAAQRFTPAMARTLDYLNTTTRFGRYFLIEVIRLQGADLVAHATQVVAAPPRTSASGAPAEKANQADFLDSLPGEDLREAMREILDNARTLGLQVHWGSRGASLRLPVTDRPEPLSVAWVFPDGFKYGQARHLTLGVEPAALAKTPSVQGQVATYLQRARAIPQGQAAASPEGAMFEPAAIPAVKGQAIAALSDLVTSVRNPTEAGDTHEGQSTEDK